MRRALLSVAGAAAIAVCSCSHAVPPGVDDAIARGVAFLVSTQNANGSWGNPASTLSVDLYAHVPDDFDAFRVGASALAVSGLFEAGRNLPGAADAVRKGTDFLLANAAVHRGSQDTLYNTFALAYAIEAFARQMPKEKDGARRAALKKGCETALDRLQRYEFVDGGWGYYDFDTHTKTPGHGATSFTTATCLVAMKMAAEQGVDVPQKLADRAIALVEHCRAPGGVFCYDFDLRFRPQMGVNHVKGALARTPSCLLALDMWGVKCPDSAAKAALDSLETQGHFLRIARKYPYPHESWYQNSGYFCFYGYFYASRLVDHAPRGDRQRYREEIASRLIPLQEKDGSFWDWQLYGFHKAYGTGFVLLTLANCR